MRTTLTIDPDVAKKIEQERRRTQRSLKQIINDALRRGLSSRSLRRSELPRYRVKAKRCGFRPGVDPERLNQLLDQLDADELASTAAEVRGTYRTRDR